MSVQMGMESVVTVMVGNKVDLEDKREVPLQTASKVCDITTATSQELKSYKTFNTSRY